MTRTQIATRGTKCLAWFAAGVMAVGSVGLTGCNKDETGKTPGQKAGETVQRGVDSTNDAAKQAGSKIAASTSNEGTDKVEGARGTLEGIVEKAGKRNDWNDMADRFTKADADRFKATKPDTKDLDDLADKFASAWAQKYGSDKFSVMDKDKVFAPEFLKLTTDPSGTKDNPKATGTIASNQGLPELTLNFVGEGGKWRLDIPDSVDGKKLHDNLVTVLTGLQDSSKWDADKVTETRAVAHRILAAVMDKTPSTTASAE